MSRGFKESKAMHLPSPSNISSSKGVQRTSVEPSSACVSILASPRSITVAFTP